MRVIAGRYKGRKLLYPQSKTTRPTSDMVKEAIFAKVFEKVKDCDFLDAFCGSGQMGIEALSRGAKTACFIDESMQAIMSTKSNLENINAQGFKVIKGQVLKVLERVDKSFDIIFLDPPYQYQDYKTFFKLVLEKSLLNEDGIVICEHVKEQRLEFDGFDKISEKNYGKKTISYFQIK